MKRLQNDFDAQSYVKSSLDAEYHREYADYANLMEISEEDVKKQMEEEGTDWKLLDEIHTPVGMPINAETPEEIAISIVSELIHEKNSLRKTSGYKKKLMEYLTGRKKAENGMALATITAHWLGRSVAAAWKVKCSISVCV